MMTFYHMPETIEEMTYHIAAKLLEPFGIEAKEYRRDVYKRQIEKNEKWFIVGFIAVSTICMALAGQPAVLLVLAGALNGLILPITLGVCLIASQKKSIMGEDYHHPVLLLILGIVVVVVSGYLGITSLSSLTALFA